MVTDEEIVIRLRDIAQTVKQFGACNLSENEMRTIADRFASFVKAEKEQRHVAVQG